MGPPPGFEKINKNLEPSEENFYNCMEDIIKISKSDSKWSAEVHVPHQFHSHLFGRQGKAKQELQNITESELIFPDKKKKNAPIVITSTSLESVQKCLDRIQIVVTEAKANSHFTHFAAFPLTNPDIQENFERFKQMVMDTDTISPSCKDDSLFVPSSKLHLTLSMAKVFTEKEMHAAKRELEAAGKEIGVLLAGQHMVVNVQGLSTMNENPSKTHVLYANAVGEHVQRAANLVRYRFISLGLYSASKDDADADVKLHMTLMNSRKKAETSKLRKRKPFNAKCLLEKLGEFYFGTMIVDTLSLCVLKSSTETKNKFYETEVEVKF